MPLVLEITDACGLSALLQLPDGVACLMYFKATSMHHRQRAHGTPSEV